VTKDAKIADARHWVRHGPWGLVQRGGITAPYWTVVHYGTDVGPATEPCDVVLPHINVYRPSEKELVDLMPEKMPRAFAKRLVARIFEVRSKHPSS
jgi:hypothetical protein